MNDADQIEDDIIGAFADIDNDMQEAEDGDIFWISASPRDGKIIGKIEYEEGAIASFELTLTKLEVQEESE